MCYALSSGAAPGAYATPFYTYKYLSPFFHRSFLSFVAKEAYKMRPFSQKYTELPAEEKQEEDDLQSPTTLQAPKWSKKARVGIISVFILVLLMLLIGIGELAIKSEPEELPLKGSESDEEVFEKKIRATGDQYLLGVGKADITGYV